MLGFQVEIEKATRGVTSFGGLVLVLETMRAVLRKTEFRRLAKAVGLRSWRTARRHFETLVLLVTSGGEVLSDVDVLRGDPGLWRLLGFKPSSATQLKEFLYSFHQGEDGKRLGSKADGELAVRGEARIRPEGPGLVVLGEMLGALAVRLQAVHQRRTATMDVDATILEASKEYALWTYKGMKGYQPQAAWWAEQRVFVRDEYRDGNVPAEYRIADFLKKTFGGLPGSVVRRRLRGDSALYNEEALTWADSQGIEFAVSADMSQELAREVRCLPESEWRPYRSEAGERDEGEAGKPDDEREWAEVCFVPDWARNRKKGGEPFRYIAIRVRSRQLEMVQGEEGELLPRPPTWRHFAVVTNMDWVGDRLLRWQREKQGTVEWGHDLVKNGLAARIPPTGRFGANAAFYRLTLIAHAVQRLLQVKALPDDLQDVEPKTLRFRLFRLAGRVVRSGRRLVLKLAESLPGAAIVVQARRAIVALAMEVAALPN